MFALVQHRTYSCGQWALAFAVAALVVCAVGCTSHSHPETKLQGKWQSDANKAGIAIQFEFLSDGSVIKNEKARARRGWEQLGTGTFKFIDPTHVKVELQPNWYFGVTIYEVVWQNIDHVGLRAADEIIQLSRTR